MRKTPLAIIATFAVLRLSLSGQTPALEKAPFPSGPLPAKTPDFAKWTVTITGKPIANPNATSEAAKAEAAKPSKTVVTVTKTLPVRQVITVSSKDGESTVWCIGHFQVHQNRDFKKPTLFTSGSETYLDFSRTDFPELQWISEKNFQGIQTVQERKYLVFRDRVTDVPEGAIEQARAAAEAAKVPFNDHSFRASTEAYIDAETKLPSVMRKNGDLHVYKFEEPPDSALNVPLAIKSMVEAEQARLKQLARRPPAG